MLRKVTYLILFAFISLANSTLGQVKFEKEYRVKVEDIPEKALQVVNMWDFKKNVKWYAEESNDGKTFEAKVCHQNNKLSIEFSVDGDLLDVEKTVKFSKLQKEIQQKIKKTLAKKFIRYSIKKVQLQYAGAESEMYAALFQLNNHHDKIVPKYEIIVKGKKENGYRNFEMLFNQKGEIEKQLLIKSSDSINLEF